MASTTVANVLDREDTRILPSVEPKYLFRETRSSRELYEEYKASNEGKLLAWGITDDEYIRKPNGTNEYDGLWVPPYPRDIWDFWVNYRFEGDGTRFYYSESHPEYIPVINSQDEALQFIANTESGNTVYSSRLLYLWDFIYNPEILTSRTLSRSSGRTRKRPFPIYTEEGNPSDEGSIIPPYLPDATFPASFSNIYPWAAWEIAIDLSKAQIQDDVLVPLTAVRKQTQKFVRAHGSDRILTELNTAAYRFTPHDAPNVISRVVRPLYPIQDTALYRGFYAVPYAPLVMRNLTPFNSNGWIFCYRQAVRYSSDIYLPKNRLWKEFKTAARLLYETPGMSVGYAVMVALPRQTKVIWPGENVELLENNVTLDIPEDRATLSEAVDVRLMREILNQVRNFQDIYELAATVSGPIMEEQPYMVVTVQVHETAPLDRQAVSFDTFGQWILTVPPLLSVTRPLQIETFKTDAALSWQSSVHNGKMKIMFDNDDVVSSHQIRVVADERGDMAVTCKVEYVLRRKAVIFSTTYKFNLGWFNFKAKIFRLDHSLSGTTLNLSNDVGLNFDDYYQRQFADEIFYSYAKNESRLKSHIEATWPLYDIGDEDVTIRRDVFVADVDFSRPIILARDVKTKGHYYVFIIKLQPTFLQVPCFGEQTRLAAVYNNTSHYIIWKDPQRKILDLTDNIINITVVSPHQLGSYLAEVRPIGTTGLPEYTIPFHIKLTWNKEIPLDFIQRTSFASFEQNGSWTRDNHAVRYQTIVVGEREYQYVYDLRTSYNGQFYQKMISAWARNYLIDLENYAQCFPYVIEYCRQMDIIVSSFNHKSARKVQIVDHLSPNLRQFLPSHLAEPLLNITLHETDVDPVDSRYAYVIYDPLYARWINILALEPYSHQVEKLWLPPNHDELAPMLTHVQKLFNRISIELHAKGQRPRATPTPGWIAIRQEYDNDLKQLVNLRRELQEISNDVQLYILDFKEESEYELFSFVYNFGNKIYNTTVYPELERFTIDVQSIREYARFVSSVLWPCLRMSMQILNESSKPEWMRRHKAMEQVWMWWKIEQDGFKVLWKIAKRFYTYASTYSVFGLVLVRSSLLPQNEFDYFFINLRQDGLVHNSVYVLAKFLNFVCTHLNTSIISIDDISEFEPFRARWISLTEQMIQQELQQKNLL